MLVVARKPIFRLTARNELKPCVGSFVDPTTFGLKIPIVPVEADTFAVIYKILNKCVYIDLEGTKYVTSYNLPSSLFYSTTSITCGITFSVIGLPILLSHVWRGV